MKREEAIERLEWILIGIAIAAPDPASAVLPSMISDFSTRALLEEMLLSRYQETDAHAFRSLVNSLRIDVDSCEEKPKLGQQVIEICRKNSHNNRIAEATKKILSMKDFCGSDADVGSVVSRMSEVAGNVARQEELLDAKVKTAAEKGNPS